MKASDLNILFKDLSTGEDVKQTIRLEVSSYVELMKKKGSSIPLLFNEDEEVIINSSAIEKLLKETLSGRLTNIDLAYICDCLTLGERVNYTEEKLKDIVFEIADPEINGGFKSDMELMEFMEDCKVS